MKRKEFKEKYSYLINEVEYCYSISLGGIAKLYENEIDDLFVNFIRENKPKNLYELKRLKQFLKTL